MKLLDGINDTEDELYTFDSIIETKTIKGLEALEPIKKVFCPHWSLENYEIIKKELKDYQEIKEIAKHYNWDDITSAIFNVKTDKKYRDLFNSAIVSIQEDYRKARALEIIKNKGVFVHLLQQTKNVEEYNLLMLNAFKKMAERDYKGAVEKFCLVKEEYDLLREVLL